LLPIVGTGSDGPPALADVDGDGRLEIATGSALGPLYVFNAQGESFLGVTSGAPATFATDVFGAASNSTDAPSFGALGAQVLAEFAGPHGGFHLLSPAAGFGRLIDEQLAAQQTPADNHLGVWPVASADGTPASGAFSPAFPRVVDDLQFFGAPVVADIDGDGMPEAIEGSAVSDLHAFNIVGQEPAGWPKFTAGWMIGSAAVGDINADGKLEVVATTREGLLFAWRGSGDECGIIPWRRFHHDEWGTGNYHTDARPPASLSPADVTGMQALSPMRLQITLAHVPGNDLFCGAARQFDIRFAPSPITSDADYSAATPVATLAQPVPDGSRHPGQLDIDDARFAGRNLYFALVVADAAQNRSVLLSLGAVGFPAEPTAMIASDGDGCQLDPNGSGHAVLWLVVLGTWSLVARSTAKRRSIASRFVATCKGVGRPVE
jgi:hypothetical protein